MTGKLNAAKLAARTALTPGRLVRICPSVPASRVSRSVSTAVMSSLRLRHSAHAAGQPVDAGGDVPGRWEAVLPAGGPERGVCGAEPTGRSGPKRASPDRSAAEVDQALQERLAGHAGQVETAALTGRR